MIRQAIQRCGRCGALTELGVLASVTADPDGGLSESVLCLDCWDLFCDDKRAFLEGWARIKEGGGGCP